MPGCRRFGSRRWRTERVVGCARLPVPGSLRAEFAGGSRRRRSRRVWTPRLSIGRDQTESRFRPYERFGPAAPHAFGPFRSRQGVVRCFAEPDTRRSGPMPDGGRAPIRRSVAGRYPRGSRCERRASTRVPRGVVCRIDAAAGRMHPGRAGRKIDNPMIIAHNCASVRLRRDRATVHRGERKDRGRDRTGRSGRHRGHPTIGPGGARGRRHRRDRKFAGARPLRWRSRR